MRQSMSVVSSDSPARRMSESPPTVSISDTEIWEKNKRFIVSKILALYHLSFHFKITRRYCIAAQVCCIGSVTLRREFHSVLLM